MAVWLGTFELDCHKCPPEQRTDFGCEEDSPIPGIWNLNGWEFQRCPLKLITQQSIEYLKAYNFFIKGFLPNPGGWMEQPIKFIRSIEIIDRELDKIQEEQLKKAKNDKS